MVAKHRHLAVIIATLAIAGLLAYATSRGYDSVLLTSGIAAIAGLSGYHLGGKPPHG